MGSTEGLPDWFRFFLQLPVEHFGDELVLFDLPFGFDVLRTLLDFGGAGPLCIGHEWQQAGCGCAPCGWVEGWFKDGAQGVVVSLEDGVVFVIVALGTSDGESEQSAGDDFEGFCDDGFACGGLVGGWYTCGSVGNHSEESGGDEFFCEGGFCAEVFEVGACHFITGELFFDKQVEGFIGIERADDVIAVVVGPWADGIGVGVAVAVGVSCEIEPMAAPVFAVVRGGEIALDHAGIGVRSGIGEEEGEFVGRGWDTGEVESNASDEGGLMGFRIGGEVSFLEAFEDKLVDGIGVGGEADDGWRCAAVEGL